MQIIEETESNGIKYFTIQVTSKLVKTEKIIEILNNLDDYFDKFGKLDKDALKEDLLDIRIYKLQVSKFIKKITCDCKNCLFRKTECRHIKFIQDYLNGK